MKGIDSDAHRLHGVTLCREAERAFSEGDRVQFTAPNREQHIANFWLLGMASGETPQSVSDPRLIGEVTTAVGAAYGPELVGL